MNPPPLAPTPPLPPPLPDRGVAPSAPVGQRLWKGFGSTPWWRLVVGGLIVLVSVALFTLPFDSVRLAQRHTSAAARQEFKVAIQKQVLERARTGLVGVRIIAPGADAVKEIDNVIDEVAREISTERHEVTLNNVGDLKRLIEAQREEVKQATRAVSESTAKLRSTPDATDNEAGFESLNSKIEALQKSAEQLQELQSRAKEFADDKATNETSKITVTLNGRFGLPPIGINFVGAPVNLDPDVRDVIDNTVARDAKKLVAGAASFVVLLTLFFLMLIARAFAGRAARGEQRAVIAESRERSESHARQLAEARLMVMRAQVEPHFLFNTLAHVHALQEIDPPQASTMLERLISYLRAAMPTMRETSSTLGREIEVVRAYLDLLKIRMGARLNYTIDIPSVLNNISFPPTMIATLVENAIKHGLEPKREGGTVAIRVRMVDEQIEVLVADDGLGLGGAQTGGTGVGLANTRERLKMLYGDTGALVVEPNAPSGVRALLRVPKNPPAMVVDEAEAQSQSGISPYMMQTTLLLAALLGWLGAHRLYVGHRRTGAVQTFLGVFSILSGGVPIFLLPLLLWVVLDIVWIATREFHDRQGRRIARWSETDERAYNGGRTLRERNPDASASSRAVALTFVLLLGLVGAHRFYVGRTGSALAMLFTLGGLGLWWIADIIIIATGNMRDHEGKRVSEWE
jgi:TM2 domain-containing membrane protein YozV